MDSMKIARVVRTEDGEDGVEVVVAADDDNLETVDHFTLPGIDSRPIPGDFAQIVPMANDHWQTVGYDMVNVPVAKDGEVRIIARNPDNGEVVATFHMAGDGSVTINGLVIDKDGNLRTPGEVTTSKGGLDINLSDHIHLHSMGPTKGPSSPPSV